MAIDMAWIEERYELDDTFDPFPPQIRCRLCGEIVGWLTMHSAVRHDDPVRPYHAARTDPLRLSLF